MAGYRTVLMAMAALGVLSSLAEGAGLTLVLLAVYRFLGLEDGGDGVPLERVWLALNGNTPMLVGLGLSLLVLAPLLSALYNVLAGRITNTLSHTARQTIFMSYLRIRYDRISRLGHGSMLDTLDYEVPFLTEAAVSAARLLTHITAILIYGAYAFVLSWKMGAIAAVIGLAVSLPLLLARPTLGRLGGRMSVFNERLINLTIVAMGSLRTIRLFGVEKRFTADYDVISGNLAAAHYRLVEAQVALGLIRQAFQIAAIVALILLSVRVGVATTTVVTVLALLLRLSPHIREGEDVVINLFGMAAPLDIVARALNERGTIVADSGVQAFSGLNTAISIRGVGYRHESGGPMVLKDASIEIPAGKLVTITGPSGSGKTTLINLLARLYEAEEGEILVDGVPLLSIDRRQWLDRLAFAGQDIELREGSVADNVTFGRTQISDEDIRWALDVAHVLEVVDALAEGVHTPVGDRGLRLSGGQRQRIGLARALVRRPDILILDEAMNAVDLKLEAAIYARIRKELPKSTLIVVTHRLNVAGSDLHARFGDNRIEITDATTDETTRS